MKRIFTLLIIISSALCAFAQGTTIDEVLAAIKNGNASSISRYFDRTVDITLPDKNNSYSKSQAELVLKDFFSTNGVKDFELIHKGQNGGNEYCVGTLKTRSGSFRTTIYMKQRGEVQVLQAILFESR